MNNSIFLTTTTQGIGRAAPDGQGGWHVETPLAGCDARCLAAYHIVQEALTNVTHHAQARHCWIRFALPPGALEVTIQDDGDDDSIFAALRAGARLHSEGRG